MLLANKLNHLTDHLFADDQMKNENNVRLGHVKEKMINMIR